MDDAAGEAYDKVARTLGLPYPGGPSVAAAARDGNPKAYKLPVPHVDGKYNVSFSGLKTAVINEVHNAEQKGQAVNVADMAASFQERIDQILALEWKYLVPISMVNLILMVLIVVFKLHF